MQLYYLVGRTNETLQEARIAAPAAAPPALCPPPPRAVPSASAAQPSPRRNTNIVLPPPPPPPPPPPALSTATAGAALCNGDPLPPAGGPCGPGGLGGAESPPLGPLEGPPHTQGSYESGAAQRGLSGVSRMSRAHALRVHLACAVRMMAGGRDALGRGQRAGVVDERGGCAHRFAFDAERAAADGDRADDRGLSHWAQLGGELGRRPPDLGRACLAPTRRPTPSARGVAARAGR